MRNPEYEFIIMREFRKVAGIAPEVPMVVSFTEDEEIVVSVKIDGATDFYIMNIGSDDDEFYFRKLKSDTVLMFPFPQDWLTLEEGTKQEIEL